MRRGELHAPLANRTYTSLAGGAETLIEVVKFLRPKMKNNASVAAIGKHLAQGMRAVNIPSDQFRVALDDIANTREEGWRDGTWM
jgi:hypothetical protein